jgi:hypothetical protein
MRGVAGLLLALALGAHAADDISFDVDAFEKKPFELSGYLELKPEYQWLDRDAALYALQFAGETRDTLTRTGAAAELTGVYRFDTVRLHATAHASAIDDARDTTRDLQFYEAYAAWQASAHVNADLGKRTLRWGKGYAWSPVAFFERAKDPTDPELAREGFVLLTGDAVRSFDGALKTLAFSPVLLPVNDDFNTEYGRGDDWNLGAKLYALWYDTDIDLLVAAEGSRGARYGIDFSRNLGTNLEIHGELARYSDVPRAVLTTGHTLDVESRDYTSALLGLRYLTERETTFIAEWYRNGGGYSETEMQRFFDLIDAGATNPALKSLAAQAARGGYTAPNAMRDYVYLRVSQKEPFDILYFTPALAVMLNANDDSATLIPEFGYTGITNVDLRLRAQFNRGARGSEFGEKPLDARVELRGQYFF